MSSLHCVTETAELALKFSKLIYQTGAIMNHRGWAIRRKCGLSPRRQEDVQGQQVRRKTRQWERLEGWHPQPQQEHLFSTRQVEQGFKICALAYMLVCGCVAQLKKKVRSFRVSIAESLTERMRRYLKLGNSLSHFSQRNMPFCWSTTFLLQSWLGQAW